MPPDPAGGGAPPGAGGPAGGMAAPPAAPAMGSNPMAMMALAALGKGRHKGGRKGRGRKRK